MDLTPELKRIIVENLLSREDTVFEVYLLADKGEFDIETKEPTGAAIGFTASLRNSIPLDSEPGRELSEIRQNFLMNDYGNSLMKAKVEMEAAQKKYEELKRLYYPEDPETEAHS